MTMLKEIIMMIVKRTAALAGCALLLVPGIATQSMAASDFPSVAQDEALDKLVQVRKISDRALVLNVIGGQENIIALDTAKGIVVIDTGVSPSLARLVKRRIEREFGAKRMAVINTHGHGDHTFGNQAFADSPIVGHKRCGEDMSKGQEQMGRTIPAIKAALPRMEKQLKTLEAGSDKASALAARILYYKTMLEGLETGFTLTPPTLTFDDEYTFDLGDRKLKLTSFGLAHSASDILIHCPEEGLWMTGDLFTAGSDLYIDSERVSFLSRWADNMDKILATAESTREIVPGHGESLSLDVIRAQRDFVTAQQKLYTGKESAFLAFKAAFDERGCDEALTVLRDLKTKPDSHYFLHAEIDSFGFRLMKDGKLDEALKLFLALAEFFPESDIAFDSLGEVYMKKGDTAKAIQSYERSLALNPDNENAKARLQSLKKNIVG
jgi:glyoxylase-like metal-dependent hydrolase (beta-lactamase superfamily II)